MSDTEAAPAVSAPVVVSAPAAPATPAPVVNAAPAPAAQTPAAKPNAEFKLSLDEFCRRASKSHTRSVALLAAFHHTEEKAGRTSDLASNYRGRLTAFASQPA
jgi:hypothetical protein